jgi:glycosyltransferase involved in cell wall biosynthesis
VSSGVENLATVTVCVAAYNEERHIGRLLDSLWNQSQTPLEVIVADDGSRDRTAEIAAARGATVLRLEHRGPAEARNAAARIARGDMLVFLDGDMACDSHFIERLTLPIAEGRAVGTFTREIRIANVANRWARAYAALSWSPRDRLLPSDFPDHWDIFHAIRRESFLAVGGYDDIGYGEDRTVAAKLGEEALAADGAVCLHYHPDTLREVFENGRWVGRGAAIRTLRRPWWTHSPPRIFAIALAQIAVGRTPWVLPARLVYHAGVWIGLAQSSRTPGRHWK